MILIRQYIEQANTNQAKLAEAIGISQSALSLIIAGKRQPGVALTKRIEAVTGIPRIDLRPDIFGDAQ
jgi:transcriptional regulator with XRE-family HTH domain